MRVADLTAFLMLTAVSYIIAVASEIFIDDVVRPRSLFSYLLVGTLITGAAALVIKIDGRPG